MTDYVTIPNTALQLDAPITEEVMRALRDNPLSMFEGAPGAPRMAPRAMLNPPMAVAPSSNTAAGFTGLDPQGVLFFMASGPLTSTPSDSFQIRGSSNGGASWGGWQNISPPGTSGNSTVFHLTGTIILATGAVRSHGLRAFNATFGESGIIGYTPSASAQLTPSLGATNVDAIQFRKAAAGGASLVTAFYIGRNEV